MLNITAPHDQLRMCPFRSGGFRAPTATRHCSLKARNYVSGGFSVGECAFGRTVFTPIKKRGTVHWLHRRNRRRLLFQPGFSRSLFSNVSHCAQPVAMEPLSLPSNRVLKKSLNVRAEVIICPSERTPGAAAASPPHTNPFRGEGAFSLSCAPASSLI